MLKGLLTCLLLVEVVERVAVLVVLLVVQGAAVLVDA
jgi:hypothetical protein